MKGIDTLNGSKWTIDLESDMVKPKLELYDYEVDMHETINRCSDPNYDEIKSQFELEFKRRNIAQNSPSSYLYCYNLCRTLYSP